MNKINTNDLPEYSWSSPKGKFAGFGKGISEALGRDPLSTDLVKRHPFDVEILRIAPGHTPYPAAQWEFYHVIFGSGIARHQGVRRPSAPAMHSSSSQASRINSSMTERKT